MGLGPSCLPCRIDQAPWAALPRSMASQTFVESQIDWLGSVPSASCALRPSQNPLPGVAAMSTSPYSLG
ncbi:MAG: hypothetical protein ACI8QC_002226 [Planctomycetota bacterium]|jgi:hypothetical protein